jgi:prepilin-type N-terminal cleavage/methylation domain-containing protein
MVNTICAETYGRLIGLHNSEALTFGNRVLSVICAKKIPPPRIFWLMPLNVSIFLHRESSHNMKGFTLIELIAVLVVIGVLVAAATVKFSSTSTISLRAAAEMIQADIRYTQAEAMATNTNKKIDLSVGNNYYYVGAERRDLPSGVYIATGRLFYFDSLGEPTAGGGQFVSVSDGTITNTVSVVNYTGKVSIN